MQNTEEIIAKYAVDANLFRLGSTNPKNKYPAPERFFYSNCFSRIDVDSSVPTVAKCT